MITYDKLWKTMKEKGVSQYALIKKHKVSPGQITRLKRNESVSTHTIEMFCKILDCNVEDIMEYTKDSMPITDDNSSSKKLKAEEMGKKYVGDEVDDTSTPPPEKFDERRKAA